MQLIFDRRTIFQRFARINFDPSLQNAILQYIAEGLDDYLIFFGHHLKETVNILIVRQLYLFEEVHFKKIFTKSVNITFLNLEEDDEVNLHNISICGKYDVIIAFNCLHNVNFLERHIQSFYTLLNKNGIFCGNFYGTNTLRTFKDAIIQNDVKHSTDIYQRFNPTIKGEGVASLLQNKKFYDVVVSSNTKMFQFETFAGSMQFLKDINERCYIHGRQKTPPSRSVFENIFTEVTNITLDFEIIEFYSHI